MFDNLAGKRLLIIGSDNSDMEIVLTAKSHGVYTIVVDGNPKSIKTMAKNIADESWDIDYSETEMIVAKAQKAGIDGVLAGYSEIRVLAAMKIAESMNLPFYTTKEVMDITRNKRRFKEVCKQYGVKIPTYFCIQDTSSLDDLPQIDFPVIVKPADAGGRKGISICHNIHELFPAIEKGLSYSNSHEVIIETYIGGVEFSARYTIVDGYPSLSLLKDKYLVASAGDAFISNFDIAPSSALEDFIQQMHPNICRLFSGLGINCGVAAIQGIYNESGFYVFEMNYRIGDGNGHRLISQENGTNYMDMMVHYALTGKPGITLENDDPHFRHFCSKLQIMLKPGIIAKMTFPEPGDIPEIVSMTRHKVEGMIIPEETTTGRRAFSYFFMSDTIPQMQDAVEKAQRKIVVEDINGNNMMYPYFNTNVLERKNK